MALQVPKQYIPNIRLLLGLPDENIQEFLKALTESGPKFNVYDLATDVSTRVKLPKPVTEGIVAMLARLYITREGQASPLEPFVDEQVTPALKGAMEFPPDQAETQWPR